MRHKRNFLMAETTRLTHMILRHWRIHRPNLVAQLEREHRLEETVSEAEAQATDLLYDLLHVQKVDYNQAWEIAMSDWLTPEETPSSWMKSAPLPVTSG
jgi:hypothetical protein